MVVHPGCAGLAPFSVMVTPATGGSFEPAAPVSATLFLFASTVTKPNARSPGAASAVCVSPVSAPPSRPKAALHSRNGVRAIGARSAWHPVAISLPNYQGTGQPVRAIDLATDKLGIP